MPKTTQPRRTGWRPPGWRNPKAYVFSVAGGLCLVLGLVVLDSIVLALVGAVLALVGFLLARSADNKRR
jgi:hypothetical protein